MRYRVRRKGFLFVGECVRKGKVIGTFKAFGYDKALTGIKTLMSYTVWAQ